MGLSTKYTVLREHTGGLYYDSRYFPHDHLLAVRGLGKIASSKTNPPQEILRWCRAEFGPRGTRSGRSWTYHRNGICFKTRDQAFAFRMRWEGTHFE